MTLNLNCTSIKKFLSSKIYALLWIHFRWWSRKEVGKLKPGAQCSRLSVFINKVLLGHSHAPPQWQTWVVATEIPWSLKWMALYKKTVFTLWPFTENVCQSDPLWVVNDQLASGLPWGKRYNREVTRKMREFWRSWSRASSLPTHRFHRWSGSDTQSEDEVG